MMCSARSLGSASSLCFERVVFCFVASARHCSGDRADKNASRPCTFTSISGELPTTADVVELQKIKIRRGIHDAQRAINLERIGIRPR